MRAFVVDEAMPPLVVPDDVALVGEAESAHLIILHVPAAGAAARVAELRTHLRADTMLLALTDDAALDHARGLVGAGADDHLVFPRDAALLPARLAVLGATLARRRASGPAGSEGRLRAIVELAADAVFVKDVAGRYTLVNPACARFFDRTVAECLGRTDEELLGAERARDVVEGDRLVRATRRPLVVERRRFVAGEERMFLVSTVPFVPEGDELLGVIGIGHDISERKKMEAQLHLADRMVSVGTLAAGVAHEINNPLAYVSGNLDYVRSRLADVLASHPDLADLADLAELIVALDDSIEGAERMRAIVRDLRAFSRADENERSAVDVDRVIDVAVRMTQPALRHRVRVVKDSLPVPPVFGNAARLGQVLVNLLVNSVQAMPADRDATENEIRVGTRRDGDRVLIELRDNGVGMSDEVQRHIFDPFYTTKPVGEGTGLGLWICRNTVTGMGGDIGVDSAPGHGTAFRVRLPVAPSASQPLQVAAAPSSRRPRLRVLVLDDEPKMVAGLRRMLGDENDIVPFTDAREALARINAGERYDAILCDLMMPGMDGMTFYGELTRVAPGIAHRTGFLTGGALTDPARAFVDEHAARWLQKPFEVEGLRAFVATLLSR